MPISLLKKAVLKKKQYSLLILFLLSPLFFYAQTLTGLWVGSLSNDSSTTRKDQSFEIALTEYKGKVYGYSRSEFIVDDTLYYIMKRVKGTIVQGTPSGDGDVCEVSDDEIISYNFRGKLDKGIKVTSIFRRSESDSSWHLEGKWKTNATKKYYSVTGKVGLAEEKDLTASKIFPHLEELNLANDIAFYQERTESSPVVKIAKPERNTSGLNTGLIEVAAVSVVPAKPDLQRAEPDYTKPIVAPEKMQTSTSVDIAVNDLPVSKPTIKQPQVQLAKATVNDVAITELPNETEPVFAKTNTPVKQPVFDNTPANSKPIAVNPKTNSIPAQQKNSAPVKNNTVVVVAAKQPIPQPVGKPDENIVTTNTPVKKTEVISAPEKTAVAITNTTVAKPEIKKPEVDVTLSAAVISGRKSEFSQGVNFKSDSLVIALYDNGEIDGDTVSVFMNGEVIMSHQGLKASAIKKTIHITPGNEDFSLVLFADNLGKYPPNTGLLVVYDGDDTYNLRFSSDYQKNAGIVFRRKK
jgi:hypothetical protein